MPVQTDVNGRFGHMLAQAVDRNGVSLRSLAEKLDYSYEQLRKLVRGESLPGEELRKQLCRLLDINPIRAEEAIAADKMEKRYGPAGLRVRKLSPRIARLEELIELLTDEQFESALAMIRGLVHSGRK